jgi:hypothetical protein
MKVLCKLDSPCYVIRCVPFVFSEGTVNLVKLQEVLTVAQCFSGISPNVSKGLLHRICILKRLFHTLVSCLVTVCAAVYIMLSMW